jgi:hypothetical protein
MAQEVHPLDDAAWAKNHKVAVARKLEVRLFWMMRQGWNYQQVMKFQ